MSHDDPFAGKTANADWAYYLDTAGTYTPTLTVDSGTNPDLGSGAVQDGFWHRNGHLITGAARITFGTGSSPGSGSYRISLPFDIDASIVQDGTSSVSAHIIGTGHVTDPSTLANSEPCAVIPRSLNTARLLSVTGFEVTNSNPFVWADGDGLGICFSYLADPTDLPT